MTAVHPPGAGGAARPRGRGGGPGRAARRAARRGCAPTPRSSPRPCRPRRSTRSRSSPPPSRRTSRSRSGSARPRGRRSWASGARGPRRPPARTASARPRRRGARCWTVRASTGAARTRPRRRPGPAGRARVHGARARRGRPVGSVRGQLAGPAGAAPGRDARRREADGLAGRAPVAPADVRGLERRWERLAARARALAPNPNGMVAMPVFAPARHRRRAADPRPLAPAGRHVLRRRRPRADRQGGPRAPREPPVAGGAGRPQRAAAPRGQRPREHDLRVPPRRPDVPGRHPRAPRPHRGPHLPHRRRRRHDPPRRRCRRGRASWVAPSWHPRRTARSTRSSSRPSGTCCARSPTRLDGGPGARGHDAALRPAPGHRDLRDGARRARPARPGRAAPPHAGRGRRAARRGARADRRARGLRPRLVRGARGLAGRRRRRRAVRGAALRDRGPDAARRCSPAAASSRTPTRTSSGRSRGSSCGR